MTDASLYMLDFADEDERTGFGRLPGYDEGESRYRRRVEEQGKHVDHICRVLLSQSSRYHNISNRLAKTTMKVGTEFSSKTPTHSHTY